MIGALLKACEKACVSMVAEVMISLRSLRRASRPFK